MSCTLADQNLERAKAEAEKMNQTCQQCRGLMTAQEGEFDLAGCVVMLWQCPTCFYSTCFLRTANGEWLQTGQ